MNQVELHPLLQQDALLEFCKKENILITAYSPLGSGDRAQAMKADNEPNMMDIDLLKELAKKHNTLVPQILIAWHNHRGCAAIPKSTTKAHIISNFQAADVVLTDSDMEKIAGLDRHFRYITGKFFEEPSKGYQNIYDE
ncbi:MAG TPA: aldo/keto reductase [Aequorivita sp.]|nr:aldo/keto reductase [Aequorivita sp.]